MSNECITWVFKNQDVKGADRLMLLAIADYCDEYGGCYPSYNTLARKCNVTRRTAINTCQRLQDAKQLYIDVNCGIETNGGHTNRFYMLKWREDNGIDNSRFALDDTGGSDAHDTGGSDTDITLSLVVSQGVSQELTTMPDKSGLTEFLYDNPIGPEPCKNQYTDELKNYVAREFFGWHDIDKVTTGSWKRVTQMLKQIFAVHDAHSTICTTEHLRRFIDHWCEHNKKLEFTLNANMESNYQTWYMTQKSTRQSGSQYELPDYGTKPQDLRTISEEEKEAILTDWRAAVAKRQAVAS